MRDAPAHVLRLPGGGVLTLDRPRIVGIVNVTPDSFSDGGRYLDTGAAVEHGLRLAAAGADVLDIGGQSTRPGAAAVPVQEQKQRVLPVLRELARQLARAAGAPALSIDAPEAAVAEAALDAGAQVLNDVRAGRGSPAPGADAGAQGDMLALAARRGAPIVLMHMQGEPATMQVAPRYGDVVEEVRAFLLERARAAEAAGVARGQIVIDPGIGFGKTVEHNLALMRRLDRLVDTGYAVLLGASRKRFLSTVCTRPGGAAPGPEQLVGATCATTVAGVLAGVHLFRVHDVVENRQAADACAAWVGSGDRPPKA